VRVAERDQADAFHEADARVGALFCDLVGSVGGL
jgi:hypothetical protein